MDPPKPPRESHPRITPGVDARPSLQHCKRGQWGRQWLTAGGAGGELCSPRSLQLKGGVFAHGGPPSRWDGGCRKSRGHF